MAAPERIMGLAENYAVGFLRQGRANWDEPHTRSVVYWAEEIAKSVNLNIVTQKLGAWMHDIGWFGLFAGDSGIYEIVKDRKAQHMQNGAAMATNFFALPEVAALISPLQAARVVHLVSVHDLVEELTDLDEIALMEADTLGAVDISRVTPTFDRAGGEKYIAELHRRRGPAFVTDRGKQALGMLLPAFEAYFKDLP